MPVRLPHPGIWFLAWTISRIECHSPATKKATRVWPDRALWLMNRDSGGIRAQPVIHRADQDICLRVLFDGIETTRNSYWKLPAGFTLTDASLAMLVTVSLDVDNISNDRVKMIRTRLHKERFPGAWAVPRKAIPQRPAADGEGSKPIIR